MTGMLLKVLPRKLRLRLREKQLVRDAAARNEGFSCRALAGESDYNICINSDLTVSCNCQDFDGSGQIGSLKSQSLAEIFAGPIANGFRKTLAARGFPTPTCASCADLRIVPVEEATRGLTSYRVPYKGIMVENTVLCNLRCRMCNRKELLQLRSQQVTMPLADVEKVALLLKEHQVQSLLFFNLGEPFLPPDVDKQLQVIRKHNPDIRIVTSSNGQLLDESRKIEAALMTDYIYVSLDGATQDAVSRYQVGADFDRGYRNIRNLVSERDSLGSKTPIVEWKYVVFRWNDRPDQIRKAIELAREAKVDVIGFYRGDGPLGDRSLRWYYHSIFKTLGDRVPGGIVVNLNNIPQHLLAP